MPLLITTKLNFDRIYVLHYNVPVTGLLRDFSIYFLSSSSHTHEASESA